VSQLTGLKGKVYRTNSYTEEEMKENIRREILKVPQKELLRMNSNLFKRYKESVRIQGQHLGKMILLFLWSDT
jgi:hypothetical protein